MSRPDLFGPGPNPNKRGPWRREEWVTKYGKFSHFEKICWFIQIVITYPDKYPDNISNQEIRSVKPNRPVNTG